MASTDHNDSPGRTIVCVHGRGRKPSAPQLERLWVEGLRAGLARDYPDSPALQNFESANIVLAYYGDLINERRTGSYDESMDVADLDNALTTLAGLATSKKFRRSGYEHLPGRSSLKEFLADIGAPVLSTLRLTEAVLSRRMPELAAYWHDDAAFAQNARQRVRERLREAFSRGDEVLVVSHCLGSVITYDALWELSHVEGLPNQVSTWITIGSPIADEYVKRQLHGAKKPAAQRYPRNIVNWYNIAAEDDFTCHDETVANDFAAMQQSKALSRIKDYRIYNLAVRYGRSNPHNFIGYVTHPRVTKLLGEWLSA